MSEVLDQGQFPWEWVAIKGGQGFMAVAAIAGLLMFAARKQERTQHADANRVRWTDAARWER